MSDFDLPFQSIFPIYFLTIVITILLDHYIMCFRFKAHRYIMKEKGIIYPVSIVRNSGIRQVGFVILYTGTAVQNHPEFLYIFYIIAHAKPLLE